jgi:putative heme iron utilization protein
MAQANYPLSAAFQPLGRGGVAARVWSAKIALGMARPTPQTDTPALQARAIMRAADRAALATSQGGWPFASLVLVALDHDATPLLLISDLSEHAKNIKAERRVSLLFDGTQGLDDPLRGPRVTVLGEASPVDDQRLTSRFLARHHAAELYAGFADFHLHRVSVTRAHLVAGFGRIHWVEARELLVTPDSSFAREEPATLAAVNTEPKIVDAVVRSLGLDGDGWRITGLDPEGLDLRRAGSIARLTLPLPSLDRGAIRAALARGEFPGP